MNAQGVKVQQEPSLRPLVPEEHLRGRNCDSVAAPWDPGADVGISVTASVRSHPPGNGCRVLKMPLGVNE